ncbi:unnamed protein product [Phytophthora fragariaefolia]|uniref:Unnamed protein product n=1 Tax=Phytophthora fragariaefolia TaxID=1490495 RepID=A0A9W6YI90_9STRA|nr:unnamed protein product [Phytophthora fragariaefolia]
MDQRDNPYGMPNGRVGMPNGLPQQQQQRGGMQQHYSMQDMMFDPLPMSNGLYHPPPPMHQQHAGMGLQQQMGMVAPEDDPRFVDDLLGALGNDPVGLGGQQQQQHLGTMASHVYDQQHVMQPHSQPAMQPGRTQGMPMTSQAPMQQNGMPGSMHMNQMTPNGVDSGARMGVGIQPPSMGAPPVSSNLGTLGGLAASIPAANAPRQAAVAPSAIVPTSTKSSTSSRALATSSNNGGSSDEDAGMGEDDAQKKKERRRQQVRYASPVFADGGHERASADGGVREADADGADAAQGQQQAEGAVAAARELRSHDPVRSERAAE